MLKKTLLGDKDKDLHFYKLFVKPLKTLLVKCHSSIIIYYLKKIKDNISVNKKKQINVQPQKLC